MDPARAHELLAAERQRIEAELRASAVEPSEEPSTADLGSDTYTAEFDEGRGDDLREELAAVERAEARLAAGSYGLSIESGAPIPDMRLEAVPTAELTTEEQARREGRAV